MKALFRLLLPALLPLYAFAQVDTAAILHPAEDFVTVSVCVASPGEEMYSSLGHACLRLQCPSADLDYVYSYESEDATQKVLDFFAGKLKMLVLAVPTKIYVGHYAPEGRGVEEYILNLPVRVKQRLWQQMDKRLAYAPVPYDYLNRGCALSILRWLEEAIGKDSIEYAPWPEKYGRSRAEIVYDSIANEWSCFSLATFVAGEVHKIDIDNTRKVLLPTELIEVLQGAKAFGEPILTEGNHRSLLEARRSPQHAKVTPIMVAFVILFLSLLNLRLHNVWLRWAMLVPCLLIGTFVLCLVLFSALPCTQWSVLVVPFCPLPFIFWKGRRWWTLPFALVCVAWIVGIMLYPHRLADGAHLVLAGVMALCNIEIYMSIYKRKQI
ncbi:MAG: DUF4105 domain-containing protein [Bacteroidaceae bacterium]|nr:DUF4105 domain-containing protein [Bacteroidaceae bacterium]